MLDLHVIHAIGNALTKYRSEGLSSLFAELSPDYRTKLEGYLAKEVTLDSAFQNKEGGLPIIVVQQSDSLFDDKVLANQSPSSDTHARKHIMTNKTVVIAMMAAEMDTVRLLHRICQAALIHYGSSFLNVGYQNLLYRGSQPLTLDDDVTTTGLATFGRMLKWSAVHILEIDDKPLQNLPVEIQPFGDGNG